MDDFEKCLLCRWPGCELVKECHREKERSVREMCEKLSGCISPSICRRNGACVMRAGAPPVDPETKVEDIQICPNCKKDSLETRASNPNVTQCEECDWAIYNDTGNICNNGKPQMNREFCEDCTGQIIWRSYGGCFAKKKLFDHDPTKTIDPTPGNLQDLYLNAIQAMEKYDRLPKLMALSDESPQYIRTTEEIVEIARTEVKRALVQYNYENELIGEPMERTPEWKLYCALTYLGDFLKMVEKKDG